MWIPIQATERSGAPFLLRMLDGTCCIGRWSSRDGGWFACADSAAPAATRVYPTHAMPIPALAPVASQMAAFQVSWRDCLPERIEAADAHGAALAFQQQHEARADAEIVVVSADGIESVFGYRQAIPTAHLDD
jgi:hypothetical protein